MQSQIINNLQKYRVWKGIRQTDLAKCLGISNGFYRKIEAGHYPKYQIRIRICKYFDVNQDQMFFKVEEV